MHKFDINYYGYYGSLFTKFAVGLVLFIQQNRPSPVTVLYEKVYFKTPFLMYIIKNYNQQLLQDIVKCTFCIPKRQYIA